ncbi:MAG: glycosyltransferase 87 family protein [Clostridia bacterium]|nr:glycosyltransferase 87 family protein [Clostridia bacterium]
MRKKWFCLILCILIILSAAACKKTVSPVLTNPDLTELRNDGTPIGWSVESYESLYEVSTADGVVTLYSPGENDLRIYQDIEVSGGTGYIISADIRTEGVTSGRGASLSIDNYSIDGCCIYSYTSLLGDNDWQRVELAFVTNADQTQVRVALRLGGYSEASSGTAEFRNISMVQSSDTAGFQGMVSWISDSSDSTSGKTADEYIAFFSVIQLATFFAALFLIFGIFRNRHRISAIPMGNSPVWVGIAAGAIVIIGLIIRVLLCARYRGHPTDINCWISWGASVAESGVGNLYATSWCDYPPAYLWICALLSKFCSAFGLSTQTTAGLFVYMIPAFLADIGVAFLAVKQCEKMERSAGFKLMITALIILNPALGFLSGAWSQIDSILTLFLLLSFISLMDERRILAGLFYGIAILFKWQALIFGPALACVYLFSLRTRKDVLKTFAAVGVALATVFLGFLLAKPSSEGVFYFIERFMSSASGYSYASVEAYNFMSFIGGNWTDVSSQIYGTFFTYEMVGVFSIILTIGITVALFVYMRFKRNGGTKELLSERGRIMIITALMMYAIYTFGHYMHERYVIPVIFFILFAYVYIRDWRLLLCVIILTLTTFLNEMTAMYVVDPLATGAVRGGMIHNNILRFCSFAEVAGFVYFALTAKRLIFTKEDIVEL